MLPITDDGFSARLPAASVPHYVILGAGCAGLSLCYYLLEAGVQSSITIIDRRTDFEDDRTWCFWDTHRTPFTPLAANRWETVAVRHGETESRISTPETPYLRLRGADFYAAALARIRAASNVALRLGVGVTGAYHETETGVCVPTSAGAVRGTMLFDALALSGASGGTRPVPEPGSLVQQFWGQTVRTVADTFDPGAVTLMDFRPAPGVSDAIAFMYVLPFSAREALVESTLLHLPGAGRIAPGTSRAVVLSPAENACHGKRAVAAYLRDRYGVHDYETGREESGCIAMTTGAMPVRTGRRTFAVGLAGGAARPSSGYAFLRTQRQCRALANAVASGDFTQAERPVSPPLIGLLDRVFLRAMTRRPDAVPGYFTGLFARTRPASLVRLLSDTASPGDIASVVRSLPVGDFLRAALSLRKRDAP
ncbi:MAG: hypothetical protein H7Y38_14010 [Armatimonadetes bacterium]|nr:hypothetical protein [Armatimonadota bacterium]